MNQHFENFIHRILEDVISCKLSGKNIPQAQHPESRSGFAGYKIEHGKKLRKKVFREMKQLEKKVEYHARIHRELLEESWEQTRFSRNETDAILSRIDGVLEQLPDAIKQAHERIIGERQVANDKKIISLYEEDIHVVKRGKAGADVEFGNVLTLGETQEGLIDDWFFKRKIEAIRDDPLASSEQVQSPSWHLDALNETQTRVAAGLEKPIDREQGKTKLRKEFE